jgi:prepilin-type N-terminal cleavage/methylation domain-containing protein
MTNSGRRNLFDLHRPVIHSTFSICDCRGSHAGCKTRAITGDTAAATGGFTLIEVLVVIAIIIILAGLILSTAGYVQKKGARARAETEIATISAAIESYKADNGIYPANSDTNTLNAQTSFNPTAAQYQNASLYLYNALFGATNGSRNPDSGTRSYFVFKPNMLSPSDQTLNVQYIRDPFGNSYGYSTVDNPVANPSPSPGYNPTFDLWSTAGGTTTGDVAGWIKNW